MVSFKTHKCECLTPMPPLTLRREIDLLIYVILGSCSSSNSFRPSSPSGSVLIGSAHNGPTIQKFYCIFSLAYIEGDELFEELQPSLPVPRLTMERQGNIRQRGCYIDPRGSWFVNLVTSKPNDFATNPRYKFRFSSCQRFERLEGPEQPRAIGED